MASAVVYNGVRKNQPNADGLFAGMKFWFSNTVPQRSRFIADVTTNGGEVVLLEKMADVCLYDHARKNPPPGMYSYRYVEHSVRNGRLEDLEAHRIGGVSTRADRPVGSVTLASKGSRAPFTEADDQMLWDWVKPVEGIRGSAGNTLYQDLEKANPRHTYQSWRDRWLKYVQFQKRTLTPKAGEQQHAASPTVNHPKIPSRATRATSVNAVSATVSPSLVVEMPVEDSTRRKRGRPRKAPHRKSNDDTFEVLTPLTSRQQWTPTRSMRKENAEQAQKGEAPTSTSNRNTGSWEFSDDEKNLLLVAVNDFLEVPEKDVGMRWALMAEQYQTHTAHQWRRYFEEVVLPIHRSRQKHSTERDNPSDDGDTKAKSRKEMQEEDQVAQPHPKKVKQEVEGEREATVPEAHQGRPGPSSQPQSLRNSGIDVYQHGPKGSRKRSLMKSNSPEPAGLQQAEEVADRAQALSWINVAEQQSDGYIQDVATHPTKRRKLCVTEAEAVEIPSTPEHAQGSQTPESDGLEALPGSPTPRARKRLDDKLERSFSPAFVPSAGSDEEDSLPTTVEQGSEEKENIDPERRTSPISVHLVSEHDTDITVTSSAPNRNSGTGSARSSTPEFETAPESSPMHENISEEGERDKFETAAESQATAEASRPNTQMLFAAPTQNGVDSLDLGLPEPEGGWDAIEPDLAVTNDDGDIIAAPDSSSSSTASTLGLDLDSWVALRTGEGQDVNLLLTAAEATNLHKRLADMVYERLESGQGVPENVKGVWTRDDDKLLMGTDARGIRKVEEKHGQRSVGERFECLGVWKG